MINLQFHGRAKHIGMKFHFIREFVSDGTVKLQYCQTDDMISDMLRKHTARAHTVKKSLVKGLNK